jgi:hypothetical protein
MLDAFVRAERTLERTYVIANLHNNRWLIVGDAVFDIVSAVLYYNTSYTCKEYLDRYDSVIANILALRHKAKDVK